MYGLEKLDITNSCKFNIFTAKEWWWQNKVTECFTVRIINIKSYNIGVYLQG